MHVITPALVAMLLVTTSAHAQKPAAYVIPSVPAPRDPLPRFTIAPRGGALGPVGLPLPPIGLQPPVHSPQRARRGRSRVVLPWPMMVFYVPQPVGVVAQVPEPERVPAENPPAPGRLILDIEPAIAQVFADGYYVGVPEDFSAARGGGVLEAGTHRIDISAAGHESMTMDVRVNPGQPVTVRGVLKALPPPDAVPRSTFYLIPGCYIGNIPPSDAGLPSSCDQSRAIAWKP
jgi:hypothetical protein